MRAKLLQLWPTLCDPVDYSRPQSSIHGILQERILEWVAVPSTREFPDPEIKRVSLMSLALADGFFTTSPGDTCRNFNIPTWWRAAREPWRLQ